MKTSPGFFLALGLVFFLCSCSGGEQPILQGKLHSVQITDKPLPAGTLGTETWRTLPRGTVQVFAKFIAVTNEQGIVEVIPNGHYKNLRLTNQSK